MWCYKLLLLLIVASPTLSSVVSDDLCPDELSAERSNGRCKRQATPNQFQGGNCILPPYPEQGSYTVGGIRNASPGQAYPFAFLNITCYPGFILANDVDFIYCNNGQWSKPMPKCVRFCRLPKHDSITYYCTGYTGRGSRICGSEEPIGMVVKPVCRHPNYYYPSTLDNMICSGGYWNYVPICKPECGRITPEGKLLVTGGKTAKRGELPWHAGIYSKSTNPYMQICGGSLVSTTIIISAAHCFWSDVNKLLPPSNFAVAVGKIYRPWNNPRDTDAQTSDVADIKITQYFQGAATNFQDDIALVIVSTPFTYQVFIRPVCLDFDDEFDKQQLFDSNLGKVAGWGLNDSNGNYSQVLKVVKLPFVSVEKCYEMSPHSFREFITSDKICAGYTNGTALCQGDSGGGLAFPAEERGVRRYFLRGVVSTAPKNEDLCSTNALTAFTRITKHEDFIKNFVYAASPLPSAATSDNNFLAASTTLPSVANSDTDSWVESQRLSSVANSGTIFFGAPPTLPFVANGDTGSWVESPRLSPVANSGTIFFGATPALPSVASSENICRTNQWRCQSGNMCILLDRKCDGRADCPDGSDEAACGIQSLSSRLQPRCVLPPHPEHGSYTVVGDAHASPGQTRPSVALRVSCDTGYILDPARSSLYCLDGAWSDVMPKCVRYCALHMDPSVEFRCSIAGSGVESKECGPRVPVGVIVKAVCRAPMFSPLYGATNDMECVDGLWNHVATCKPECGRVTPKGMTLVSGGETAYRGELPWHAAIYKKSNTSHHYICGGSLITRDTIITAANCFWYRNTLDSSNEYAVAVGKIYKSWRHPGDQDAQESDIDQKWIHPDFEASRDSFQNDIAVVIVKFPFTYQVYIRPVCLDFDLIFDRQQLQDNNLGKVAGWGYVSEKGEISDELQVAEIPFINRERCLAMSRYRKYITSDKICAGYTNGTALCRGDSGGGLVFPAIEDGERYYLRGVVSSGLSSGHQCNVESITVFTQITKHKRFIDDIIVRETTGFIIR